jgi:hypothetical protein
MPGYTVEKVFDNFDALFAADRARRAAHVESKAKQAAAMMSERAPVSDINEPGYEHFKDAFRVEKESMLAYLIFNDKIVNGYELWKLLEFGARTMSPRKTIGPVMDIIGPQFLEEAGHLK